MQDIKFERSYAVLGGWRAFFRKRPNGYLREDIDSISSALQSGGDFSYSSPLITPENPEFYNGVVEVSNALQLPQMPRAYLATNKRNRKKEDAHYQATFRGKVPYVIFSNHFVQLVQYSPTYRGLVNNLIAHEIQHGNQPNIVEILCRVYEGRHLLGEEEAIARLSPYLESTTAITSPTLVSTYLNMVYQIETEHRPTNVRGFIDNLAYKAACAIEYDSDMAWARHSQDFRGMMRESVIDTLFRKMKEHIEIPDSAAAYKLMQPKIMKGNSTHPSDIERITRLGQEELAAGAVPVGSEPILDTGSALSWTERYIAEMFNEINEVHEKVGKF